MNTPLKTVRLKRGQTLRQVADAVGTDVGNVSRMENQKQGVAPAMAEKLSKHFGGEITELQILYPERFMEAKP